MPKRKPRAYSYIRFSSPEQLKGASLQRQLDATKAYCEKHQLTLDKSLSMRDLGVSGFNGKNAETGELRTFLDAVDEGKVPPGSVLIVERLDRLSRDKIRPALTLFLRLIEAGVEVVTLQPEPRRFNEESANDIAAILIAIIEMSRAHGESQAKSERMADVWARKKRNASQKLVTKQVPAWLEVRDGEICVKEAEAETVREIFRLCADGMGQRAITKHLNEEGVPNISGGDSWGWSYIAKILKSRAVIGEYQPGTTRDGKHSTEGKPVPNYFPAIVDEALFFRAQAAIKSRRGHRGPNGKRGAMNIFQGLIYDAATGTSLVIANQGFGTKSGPAVTSSAAARGEAKSATFPLKRLEKGILLALNELSTADLMDRKKAPKADRLEAKLADVEDRISKLQARLKKDADLDALIDVLRDLEGDRKRLEAEIEDARAAEHSQSDAALGDVKDLIAAIQDVELWDGSSSGKVKPRKRVDIDIGAARLKLRQRLRMIIERIDVAIDVHSYLWRRARVEIKLKGGKRRQLEIIRRRKQVSALTGTMQPEETHYCLGGGGFRDFDAFLAWREKWLVGEVQAEHTVSLNTNEEDLDRWQGGAK